MAAHAGDPNAPSLAGSGRVLIVDDNAVVRHGLARVLRSAGYAAVEAQNGLAALMEVERQPFGAVVLDLMMPVMDGVQCFKSLAAAYPIAARRVLFATAWADDPVLQRFLAATGRPVLQKPFDVDAFVTAVRSVEQSPTSSMRTT